MSSRARSTSAPIPRRARAALALAAAGAAASLAACGSDGPGGEASEPTEPGGVVDISGTEPVGEVTAGSVAQLVTCRDWNGASQEQRLATIEDVRSQSNPDDPGIEAPELTDEEALGVFDSACEPDWAQGFRLYKIYARAVAFVPLKRRLEEAGVDVGG